uniref:Serine/threonine-protein kinase RIO3 n=1 Tax=Parascaris univalens TaxID=6257 RepID=A0A915B8I8_PARUN
MDAATRMILYKWINSGELFDRVEGVIATGKESPSSVACLGREGVHEFAQNVSSWRAMSGTDSSQEARNDDVIDWVWWKGGPEIEEYRVGGSREQSRCFPTSPRGYVAYVQRM